MDEPASNAWQRIAARHADLGGGFAIARALPTAARRTVGAWCFLDHAGPARFPPGRGMQVGPHPHIGLQTFTWMIEGEVLHNDSLGNRQVIRPGEVNLMSAGRGIAHSEESVGDSGAVHAAQLWIALPDAHRHGEPAFVHHAQLPVVQADGFRVTVLAGRAFEQQSPVPLFSELVGVDLTAERAARTRIDLEPRFEHALLCLRGHARVDGEPIQPGTLLYAAPGRTQVGVGVRRLCATAADRRHAVPRAAADVVELRRPQRRGDSARRGRLERRPPLRRSARHDLGAHPGARRERPEAQGAAERRAWLKARSDTR